MDGSPFEETMTLRSDVGALLAEMPIFSGLDATLLREIASAVEWLSLPGGARLFSAGDPPDALYMVLSGCLGAFSHDPTRRRFLARIAAGEMVGEMGLISGRPRSADVVALRDTELARISAKAFNEVLRGQPEAMLRIARLTVDRLAQSQSPAAAARSRGACTFTVLPQSVEVDFGGFASRLVKALSELGRAELVWSVRAKTHTSQWFNRIESANDYVVYVADPAPDRWTKLCVRQADALLLLARAESPAGSWAALRWPHDHSMAPQRSELVLLHDSALETGAAARWLADLPELPHHHVQSPGDYSRLARVLTGRGVGLVLSGGGARGFAHIGVVKALREAGVPVDLAGGTSMGAILGAGVALRWSTDELKERFRRAFVDARPLRDYTLPFVSLVSGRKVSTSLYEAFGDLAIEDLPIDFFCVSSNLTTGQSMVHRRGTLWRWLRSSVSVPGVLPPVLHNGEVLVDGATMNNLPVDVMREFGRGPVIGCDVGGADRAFTARTDEIDVPRPWHLLRWMKSRRQRPSIFQILWRAGMVNSNASTIAHRAQSDLIFQPPLAEIDMLDWDAFDKAIQVGYDYAIRKLEELPADSPLLRCAAGD
ncbi:MAG TPA: patatin-like phospholipase family protein [Steroidobacteraceae bacterium]|nr:patatin-like phospholipase family protein [Steroidobacteraceae bacterium]